MPASTDTFIQHIAQQLGGHGWAVAGLIVAASLVIAIAVCLISVWQEVRKNEAQLQRDLERSTRERAGGYEQP